MPHDAFDEPEDLLGYKLDATYELTSVLGGGATSVVFSGRHLVLDRPVAVKLLHPTLAMLPEMRTRFMREASAAASVDHPNLVRVMDARVGAEGFHYLVMEHLRGRDLARWAAERAPLSLADLMALAVQLAEVLEAVHAVGLVHRDLKPENIIVLDGDEGPPRIKLIDLGIVAQAGGGDPATRLTRGDVTLGTVFYMSPEQAAGATVDGRSDVYALGCVLWELAVGRPWVGDGSPSEVLARHLSMQPEAPSRHRSDLPAWFDALVSRCLAKKPEQRFASAAELAAALRAWRAPTRRRAARSTLLWAAVAALVGVAAGLGLGPFVGIGPELRADAALAVDTGATRGAQVDGAESASGGAEAPSAGAGQGAGEPRSAPQLASGEAPMDEPPPVGVERAAAPESGEAVAVVTGERSSELAAVEVAAAVAPSAEADAPSAGKVPRGERTVRAAAQRGGRSQVERAVDSSPAPRRAKLVFAVEPEGSEVRRNGVVIGRTPLSVEVDALDSAVAYEVSHPSRVTLKLVYASEADRVITRSLPRLEAAPAASAHPGVVAERAPLPRADTKPAEAELWRPSRPGAGGAR